MKNILWIAVSLIWLLACDKKGNSSGETKTTPERPVISVIAPEFNADSAYYFVEKQVDFGPRVPNTQAHRECGDYLINTLKTYGAEVTVQ
jgi:glutaminyl-peptide cyclotransferase